MASLLCLVAAGGLFPQFSSHAADEPLEYRLKAVFLLDFTKFIEWPPGSLGAPDAPFNICVLGNNPFGDELDQIVNGEVVYGRKILVQRIGREPAPGSCQILFVGSADDGAGNLTEPGRGVLTVGEGVEFVHRGGMIAFVVENRRVRFEIDQAVAERAGLKLSSKLLAVAKSVRR